MVLAVMTCRLINNFKETTTMNVNKCQLETIWLNSAFCPKFPTFTSSLPSSLATVITPYILCLPVSCCQG